MGDSNNSYIPLFALNKLTTYNGGYGLPPKPNPFQVSLFERTKNERNFEEAYLKHKIYNVSTKDGMMGDINYFKHYTLIPWLRNSFIYDIKAGSYSNSDYTSIFNHVENSFRFRKCQLRNSATYITNNYFLAHMNPNKNYRPELVFTIVFKKEYLEYIKLCMLFDEDIDPQVFELWMHKDFDTKSPKDSIYPNLRIAYRKIFRDKLMGHGIKVVLKENFDELFYNIEQPKFTDVADYNNWLAYSSEKFLYHKKRSEDKGGFFKEIDKYEISRNRFIPAPIVTEKVEVDKGDFDMDYVIVDEEAEEETPWGNGLRSPITTHAVYTGLSSTYTSDLPF